MHWRWWLRINKSEDITKFLVEVGENQTHCQTQILPSIYCRLFGCFRNIFSIAYLLFFQLSQGYMKICKTYQNIIGTELQSRFELCSISLQFYVSFDFILNHSHNSFSPPLFSVHQEDIILLQWVLNLALSTFQTWHMKLFAQKYFQGSFFNLNIIYIHYHTVILHWNFVLISAQLSAIFLCFLLLPLFLLFTYLRD